MGFCIRKNRFDVFFRIVRLLTGVLSHLRLLVTGHTLKGRPEVNAKSELIWWSFSSTKFSFNKF